jgi:hypothetical protein
MRGEPDFERVADVLVRVVLRILGKNDESIGGGPSADAGVLPSIDRRIGRRGFLDRGPGGQAPPVFGTA